MKRDRICDARNIGMGCSNTYVMSEAEAGIGNRVRKGNRWWAGGEVRLGEGEGGIVSSGQLISLSISTAVLFASTIVSYSASSSTGRAAISRTRSVLNILHLVMILARKCCLLRQKANMYLLFGIVRIARWPNGGISGGFITIVHNGIRYLI